MLAEANTRERDAKGRFVPTHGNSRHKVYHVWYAMKKRCYDLKDSKYSDYGGRGITIAPEWAEAGRFVEWALNNGYKPGLTIERKDNSGPYSPSNCMFATQYQQRRNKRNNTFVTIEGATYCLEDAISKFSTVSHAAVRARIFKWGWDKERAVLAPRTTYGKN